MYRRPRTIRGLLLRLIGAYPGHVLGLAIGASLLVMVISHHRPDNAGDRSKRCRFAQTWSAGDAYYNEELVFHRDGNGLWTQGDRHGEEQRVGFRWEKTRTTVTLVIGAERRTLGYEMERRDKGCLLRFEESPFPGSYRELYGR